MAKFFSSLWLFSATKRPTRNKKRRPLLLEHLENRLAPATFTVTGTSDDPNDGNSLRFAINHSTDASNTINIAAQGTIALTHGALSAQAPVNGTLTINGPGANLLTIDAQHNSRVFENNVNTVTIAGITLTNGTVKTGPLFGGDIYNGATMILNQDVISNGNATGSNANAGNASGGQGGGIANLGNLTIYQSTLSGNTAQGGVGLWYGGGGGAGGGSAGLGGAIYNTNTLTIQSSTITGNNATGGGGGSGRYPHNNPHPNNSYIGGVGGGAGGAGGQTPNIFNPSLANGAAGNFGGGGGGGYSSTLVNKNGYGGNGGYGGGGGGGGAYVGSGFFGQSSRTGGAGGAYGGHGGNGGNFFAGTTAGGGGGGAGLGGGIFNKTGSNLTITSSTISGNTATGGASYSPYGASSSVAVNGQGAGGGIFAMTGTTSTVDNSIIAANSATDLFPDAKGAFTDLGFNLVKSTAGNNITRASDITGQDPKLGSLQLNQNGHTPTLALLAGSPAIDKGDATFAGGSNKDQNNILLGNKPDIGASEFAVAPTAVDQTYTVAAQVKLTVNATNGLLKNDTGVSLVLQSVSGATHGALNTFANGHFNFTPTTGYSGSVMLSYVVVDEHGLTATANFIINVTPVVTNPTYTLNANTTLDVSAANGILVNDIGIGLVVGIPGTYQTPKGNTETVNADGSLTFTPVAGFSGNDPNDFTIQDGSGQSVTETITFIVLPVAVTQYYGTFMSTALNVPAPGVLANAIGTNVSAAIAGAGNSTHGTYTVNTDGSFTYTPTAGYIGTDSFTYQVTDGNHASQTATINISVGSVNFSITSNVLTIRGDNTNHTVAIRLKSGDATQTEVINSSNSTVLQTVPNASFTSIAVLLGNGTNTFGVFNVNGDPVPSGGITDTGGSGSNTLTGPGQTNAWNITGANAGTLNTAVKFTNVANLTGQSGADTYRFQPTGSISGKINGGTGINTLDYTTFGARVVVSLAVGAATAVNGLSSGGISNIQAVLGSTAGNVAGAGGNLFIGSNSATTWNITAANAGNLGGSIPFSNFPNLTGGSGKDTFKMVGTASLLGYADGGTGANTLDYSGYSNRVIVSLAANAATGFKNLSGSGIADFQTIIGSPNATNLFVGTNSDSTWNLTAANAGTLSPTAYGTASFSAFANLTGGFGMDTFTFNLGASVTGAIDGRITGGLNTLDYSSYGQRVVVSLANSAASGVKNGSGSSVFDFQNIIGSTIGNQPGSAAVTNLLVGPNTAMSWKITASNSGQLGSVPITFSNFPNLTGGTANDSFAFNNGIGLTGAIDGGLGAGINTLDYSAWTTPVTVNLHTSSANNVSGVFDFSNVFGGSNNDTITGGTSGGVLIGNGGTDTITGGTGRSVLIGGAGNDTIKGSINDDLLIAGTTSYDSNLNALLAILAEWRSAGSYATLISDLRNGTGVTAGNKLILATSVFDDGGTNSLTGDIGSPVVGELDWFFANTAVGHDTITDKGASEIVN